MLPEWTNKSAKKYAEFVYKHFGQDSGHMLLVTSAIGVALSTLAQATAVLFNKKYSVSQKAFMIPQELTEGTVSVFSLFAITLPIQLFAKKYAKTAKIANKEMLSYMKKYNLMEKRGNLDFDLGKTIHSKINEIVKSKEYFNANDSMRKTMLSEHEDVLQIHNANVDATSAISTAAGAIFTTALILPYIRNYSASHYQKVNMQNYNLYMSRKKNTMPVNYSSAPLKV